MEVGCSSCIDRHGGTAAVGLPVLCFAAGNNVNILHPTIIGEFKLLCWGETGFRSPYVCLGFGVFPTPSDRCRLLQRRHLAGKDSEPTICSKVFDRKTRTHIIHTERNTIHKYTHKGSSLLLAEIGPFSARGGKKVLLSVEATTLQRNNPKAISHYSFIQRMHSAKKASKEIIGGTTRAIGSKQTKLEVRAIEPSAEQK